MKHLLALLFIVATIFQVANAQQKNLHADSLGFQKMKAVYQTWLTNDLEVDIIVDRVEIRDTIVYLHLVTPSQQYWQEFVQFYTESSNLTPMEVMYYKMLFLFELDEKEAAIQIVTDTINDKQGYWFWINYNSEADTLQLRESMNKGISIDKYIPNQRLAGFNILKGGDNQKQAQRLINAFIRTKFNKNKHPNIVAKPIVNRKHKVRFTIRNMKNEVITDAGYSYFERLDLTFFIKKQNNGIRIKYIINAKYSKAFGDFYFWEFTPMDATASAFRDEFETYTLLLIDDLEGFLME